MEQQAATDAALVFPLAALCEAPQFSADERMRFAWAFGSHAVAGGRGRESGPARVPPEVLDGLEAVRESGLTNMSHRLRVVNLCFKLGYPEAALWAIKNRDEYVQGISHGFEAVAGEGNGNDQRVR